MNQTSIVFSDKIILRPRYGEVDQMGYVYHANYVLYCHQARTELMRKLGVNDGVLEANNILLPVISFEIKHFAPAYYDQPITIETKISKLSPTRLTFSFNLSNMKENQVAKAYSTVVFVNAHTRKPLRMPNLLKEAFNNETLKFSS